MGEYIICAFQADGLSDLNASLPIVLEAQTQQQPFVEAEYSWPFYL